MQKDTQLLFFNEQNEHKYVKKISKTIKREKSEVRKSTRAKESNGVLIGILRQSRIKILSLN